MASEKSKYTRKHEMLLSYNEKRKTIFVPFVLLLFGGFLGLHRFFLGHIKTGIAIPVIVAVFLFLITGFTSSGLRIGFPSAYGLFIVIEYFNISRIIDNRNAQMRRELAKEYRL